MLKNSMWADSWARKHGNTAVLRKAKRGMVIKSELSCLGVTAGRAPDMFNTDDWLHRDDPVADWTARYCCTHDLRLSWTLLLGRDAARRSSNTQIKKKKQTRRTKVRLLDKCWPNLNASKCQTLHSSLYCQKSSLLILFSASGRARSVCRWLLFIRLYLFFSAEVHFTDLNVQLMINQSAFNSVRM